MPAFPLSELWNSSLNILSSYHHRHMGSQHYIVEQRLSFAKTSKASKDQLDISAKSKTDKSLEMHIVEEINELMLSHGHH